MVRLTPKTVAEHIAQRRAAVRALATQNPALVAAMQAERQKYVAEQVVMRPN